jgi:lysophospholipase L1-like esterase
MSLTRRNFIKSSAAGGAAIASIPTIIASCVGPDSRPKIILNKGSVVLFQGDSITDAGRDRKREMANDARSFGNGYAFIAGAGLLEKYPGLNLILHNRGISGNKVYQLAERWEQDCLELKPAVLSILIGVNDYWHFRDGPYEGTPEIYEHDFRQLLQRTKERLPQIQLVICQPFILENTSAVDESWITPFRQYQEIARKIAVEFETAWVPFQEVFNEARNHAPGEYWLHDGVHPSMAGARLMAETWLKTVT